MTEWARGIYSQLGSSKISAHMGLLFHAFLAFLAHVKPTVATDIQTVYKFQCQAINVEYACLCLHCTLNHRSLVKLCCTNLAPTPSVKILCNLHRQGCFPTTQQEENNPFQKLHTAAGVCGAIPLHPASSMSVMSDRLTKPVPFRTWHWRPQTRFTQSIIYT